MGLSTLAKSKMKPQTERASLQFIMIRIHLCLNSVIWANSIKEKHKDSVFLFLIEDWVATAAIGTKVSTMVKVYLDAKSRPLPDKKNSRHSLTMGNGKWVT